MSYSSPPASISPSPSSPNFNGRFRWLGLAVGGLVLAYGGVWLEWFRLSQSNELHSYLPLIPFLTAYLAWHQKTELNVECLQTRDSSARKDKGQGILWWVGAIVLGLTGLWLEKTGTTDRTLILDFRILAFCVALYGIVSFTLGSVWLRKAAFPAGFLLFLTPLPQGAISGLETFFQHTSADAADIMIRSLGIPVLRDGLVFQLPTITLQVAPQCSGIRSSWMLVLTAILGGRMLLDKPLSRLFLVLFVIPLGILRNGFRILVLAWLCVEVDPSYIDSPIHHQGGPLFFVLSLIPFAGFVWILRRMERSKGKSGVGMETIHTGLTVGGKKASSH